MPNVNRAGFRIALALVLGIALIGCESTQDPDEDTVQDFDLADARQLESQENANKGVTVYPAHRDHERNTPQPRIGADLGQGSGIDE